ncbi:MAG TPA: D-2-hydroxyacid dehydrogenase [Candidatus Saccharimonadales bacterium]|nr:D-2-hydroxyacid dehydrogenase [Candidatus Saccharimonadales bacterium]
MNVLLLLALPEPVRAAYLERLRRAFPGVTINLAEHHEKVDPYIADADVLITFGAHMDDRVLEQGVNLRWIQALGTGVDGIADRAVLRAGVLVTNLHGLHGPAVSESVLASMLALARDLPRSLANQRRAQWQRFPVRLLKGKTAGILGVGAIAADLAPKCGALGMRVVGVSSTQRTVPGFERVWGLERLGQVAGEVDYLVLLTPYTAATHGIVNAQVLAAMRPSSFLINVARGGVIDEPALVTALEEHRIAGAALDVFNEEPLPPDHPLWTLDNVILTPHIAGFHAGYIDDALPIVEENMRRFIAGDIGTMLNMVRT